MALFEGLVETEDGVKVEATTIGGEDFYVIDDQGFRRHVEAAAIDRFVPSLASQAAMTRSRKSME